MKSPRTPARRRGQLGLTLIEIALAVAILAIMASLTYGTIARSFDTYEAVTANDQKYHNVRSALHRMARDISMAFITNPPRVSLDEDRQWKTLFKAEDTSPINKLTFTSFSHRVLQQDAKESDQCEISFYGEYDEDNRSQLNLMRREDPRLDSEPEEGGPSYIVAENVKTFEMRYFDAKDDDWTRVWDTEKTDHRGRMPSIVELKLTIEDEDGQELSFMTKTRILMPYSLN